MFWEKYIPGRFQIKSTVCGLEVCFDDEKTLFHYSLLKKKKNKLDIETCGTADNIEGLAKEFAKNKVPVVVIINGKGVAFKRIELNDDVELSPSDIANKYLPGLDPAQFVVQLYLQQSSVMFISFCRKDLFESVKVMLSNLKLEIADFYIGVPAISGLRPLWSNYDSIQTGNFQVEFSNNDIDKIVLSGESKQGEIKIDGVSVNTQNTLSFSGAISYLMQNKSAVNLDSLIDEITNTHFEKNKFRFLMNTCIVIAFVAAVANMIVFSTFFDKSNKLENEISAYQLKYDKLNEVLSDYQKKKGLIENVGILDRSCFSEYSDRIAQTVPQDVILKEMSFNPPEDDDIHLDSLRKFKSGFLCMKGSCSKSLSINEWINTLKMQNFVQDVNLQNFSYPSDGSPPNYEIRIKIK